MKENFKRTKSLVSLFIATMMFFCFLPSNLANAVETDVTDFCIKIVHTNDIHARIEKNEKNGIIGVGHLSSIIKNHTENSDMDLVLDSGDLFHGQSIATLVKGQSIAEVIKSCGYDAMTAGNHDWSYGKDRLKELSNMAGLKMLTGNVIDENGNSFFDDEYYIEEVTKNNKTLKVGVFGVIDPEIYRKTTPDNVKGLTFTNASEYANKASAELKAQGCDIVIALSHTNNPVELAKTVNDVDLWLCGHEHIDINTSVTTPNGKIAYIAEDSYYLYQIGLIDLDCTLDSNGNVSEIKYNKTVLNYDKASTYEEDANVNEVLNGIKSEQEKILNRVVGSSPTELDGVWEHLRIDETNLGRAITDAYLLATGADIAFENAGGIRANINAGDVTYGDLINVSPYGNYIVTKKITGQQLKEILETSIAIQFDCITANESGDWDAWPNNSGSYLQTGGITVKYDLSRKYGERVLSIQVGGKDIVYDNLYTVATNNFVAVSSVYPQLASAPEEGEFSACDEALINYFAQDAKTISESINTARMIKTKADNPPSEKYDKDDDNKKSDSNLESPNTADSPQTGDDLNIKVYILLASLGLVAIIATSIYRAKKRIK